MKKLLPLLFALNLMAASPPFPLLPSGNTGNSLLSGLAAFFPLDEQALTTAGTNRYSSFPAGLVWRDKNQNIYAIRGLTGGAAGFQGNSSSVDGLYITNSIFDAGAGKSFTCSFWCVGGGNTPLIGEWDSAAAFDYQCSCNSFAANTATFTDTGGTPHSVNSTNFTPSTVSGQASYQWSFMVFGYDASLHQGFISCNAAPKNTVSTGGLDIKASGRGFVYLPRLTILDNVGFWNRALTQQEITNLFNGGYSDFYPFGNTPGKGITDSFGWSVTNNGGTISTTTYNATKTLVDGLYSDNILTNISTLMGMPNETLPGALESIIEPVYFQGVGRGIEPVVTPWVNRHNFVNGDVSVNGVTGNGANKWTALNFSIAVTPCTFWITNLCDSGTFVYCATATSGTGVEFAARDGTINPAFSFMFKINSTFNATGHSTQAWHGYENSTCYSGSSTAGFYSIQRDAQNSLNLYFANSLNAHSLIMSTNANMSSCTVSRSGVFPVWALYDGNLCGGCNFSVNTLSALGTTWHHLSASQDANLYSRLQTYRQSIGGGFQ